MGSNKQKKGFSLFSMFKPKKPGRSSAESAREDNTGSGRRVWPSDEDKGSWVADPRINRKATDFITKIHNNCFAEYELRAVQPGAATGRAGTSYQK
ncbi:hypothetical protein Pint_21853 [Pistacia integerrima]|uniref:Uncharacterized protein n=1 Tax=Pistacia integerrima TaxID=434235 RepID=A0ACC0X988_9ROSI|nr:hypothetical protein Pint_21853 [Pistacia integerrima]